MTSIKPIHPPPLSKMVANLLGQTHRCNHTKYKPRYNGKPFAFCRKCQSYFANFERNYIRHLLYKHTNLHHVLHSNILQWVGMNQINWNPDNFARSQHLFYFVTHDTLLSPMANGYSLRPPRILPLNDEEAKAMDALKL